MTYLIVGEKGMLARAVKELLTREGRAFTGVDLPEFDVSNPTHVDDVVRPGLTAVVNCSAYTQVDAAEADEATATRVNGLGVANLARAAARADVPLVHFSTDYVFSGDASEPYPVDGLQTPLGAYGRSKAAGERAVWTTGGPHLLLRTSWLYAPWGTNFVRTIVALSKQRPSLNVVSDQRGRPTSAEHLAKVSLALLDRRARGTYHVTDGGECTWFEFAREIVRISGQDCQVAPCTSAEFPRPAKRPAYSVLDLAPVERLVGEMPDWRENLAHVMSRLE